MTFEPGGLQGRTPAASRPSISLSVKTWCYIWRTYFCVTFESPFPAHPDASSDTVDLSRQGINFCLFCSR